MSNLPIVQNWDGASPPNAPAGWQKSAGMLTLATGNALSAPNAIAANSINVEMMVSPTIDDDGNTIRSAVTFHPADAKESIIFLRLQSQTTNFNLANGYGAELSAGGTGFGIQISKFVNGVKTILGGPVANHGLQLSVHYLFSLKIIGTTLTAQLQDVDGTHAGNWLQPGGTWGAQIDCITCSDATYGGTGYMADGIYEGSSTLANSPRMDNFSATQASAPVPSFTVAPSSVIASSVTSVTLTGTNTAWTGGTTVTPSAGSIAGLVVNTGAQTITFNFTAPATGQTITFSDNTDAATGTMAVLVFLPVNDAKVIFSPYNWEPNGSTFRQSTCSGADIAVSFTGTKLLLTHDLATQIAGGVSSGDYPIIEQSISNGVFGDLVYLASILAATGLANTPHTSLLRRRVHDLVYDLYNTPVNPWRITGFLTDGSFTQSPAPGGYMLGFGDSTMSSTYNDYLAFTDADSSKTAFQAVAVALGLRLGAVCYPGWGYSQSPSGSTNIPPFYTVGNDAASAWNKHRSGVSRLVGGLFSPAPALIWDAFGVNGVHTAAQVSGLLTLFRAAAPLANIVRQIPASGANRANISTGFANYQAATPDNKCFLIDPNTDTWLGGITAYTGDGTHLNIWGNGQLGAVLVKLYQAAIVGMSAAVKLRRVSRGRG